jgi:thioredoxin reductase (NADPH)
MPESLESTKKPLVVYLDDDPKVLFLVQSLLAGEPYELLTTEKPWEALQWVGEKTVSLLISDQVMPDHLGTDFVEKVRASSPTTRCAIVTAYPEGEKLLRALKTGIALIPKPLDFAALKRTILQLLHDRATTP